MSWVRNRLVAAALAVTSLLPNLSRVAFFARTPVAAATETAAVTAAAVEVAAAGSAAGSAGSSGVLIGAGAAGAAGAGVVGATSVRGCSIAGRGAVSAIEAEGAAGRAALRSVAQAEWRASQGVGRTVAAFDERALLSGEQALLAEGRMMTPIYVATDGGRTAAATHAVATEPFVLFDGTGNVIKGLSTEQRLFENRLVGIVRDAAAELPGGGTTLTDAQLRKALEAALKNEPNLRYNLDVTSGKFTLKLKTARGEISGEVNAYSVVKRTASLAAAGYGGYAAWRQTSIAKALESLEPKKEDQ